MNWTQTATVLGLVVTLVTLLGYIFSILKRSEVVKEVLRKWLIKPADPKNPIKNNLNFFDVMKGVETLNDKLKGFIQEDTGLILCVGRGGAIAGGLLDKIIYTNRLKFISVNKQKKVSIAWDISELAGQRVLLIDDRIRAGTTIQHAYDLIMEKCKETGIEFEKMKVACLLYTLPRRDDHEGTPLSSDNIVYAYHCDSVNSEMPWDVKYKNR